jgi:hypothetical protein
MEIRLDHPEGLSDFESAPLWRVRRWAWFGIGLWLLLLAVDWAARFQTFRWQDQWLPKRTSIERDAGGAAVPSVREIPAQTGAGLTQMVPVPWIAARYAEHHPGCVEHWDAMGYCNDPVPEGTPYPVVMLGDSFMLSLGTQNVAQVLAGVGGVNVYNHARRGAGPFLEMRKFIGSGRFDPYPKVVVWNLSARELGAPLFQRQAVDYWFDRSRREGLELRNVQTGILWDYLAPAELHKAWPNTSLISYAGRRGWAQVKLLVFRGWPSDVLGMDDPRFGPMLFYHENLRVLPLLTPEADAPAVVKMVAWVARRFRERGITLVVLLVPEKEQVHIRALPPADQEALARGPELLAAIQAGLETNGVPAVNLLPVFLDATAQGTRLYWRDDTHWNDAGIHLAAVELWRVVEPLLK